MSHTNTTTNYGLPQFLSSDKPAWMADINVAFADIDVQMKTNADAASAAQTTADDAVLNGAPGYSNLSTYAVGDVVNYLGRVYKCDIAVTTPEAFDNAKWSYYRLSDASAQIDVIDGEIGSTDISGIGDGTITGAVLALDGNVNDLLLAAGTHNIHYLGSGYTTGGGSLQITTPYHTNASTASITVSNCTIYKYDGTAIAYNDVTASVTNGLIVLSFNGTNVLSHSALQVSFNGSVTLS